jgi:hypothetical protein
MTENRSSPRQRAFKGGSISTPNGIIACTIRNLSETGALIELAAPAVVPDAFILVIKPELLKRSCEVAWRRENRIGVRFK